MLSIKTKAILRKAPTMKELEKITTSEAQFVLDEVIEVMEEQNPTTDPDYFTNAFIKSAMIKRLNGDRKKN